MKRNSFKLHVFNAGAGLALAIKLPNGNWGIVDWGVPERAGELIKRIGDSTVEFICATHPHEDHTIGLPELAKALAEKKKPPVKTFWYPVNSLHESSTPLAQTLKYLVEFQQIEFRSAFIRKNEDFPVLAGEEGWKLIILAPPEERANREEIRSSKTLRVAGNSRITCLNGFTNICQARSSSLLPQTIRTIRPLRS